MNKIWRVMTYEFQRNVFKKSFFLSLVSVPLMMTVSLGMGFLVQGLMKNDLPVGIVDQAGIFAQTAPAPAASGMDKEIEFIFYQTETEAKASLEAQNLQVVYIIPVDYVKTRHIIQLSTRKPGENATEQFFNLLQGNILSHQSAEIAYRAVMGTSVTVRSLDGRRKVPGDGPTFGILMPLLISFGFLALLLISSGYLMSAVLEEKENRTIEILTTSVSPGQMISGKVFGVVAIGILLLLVWAVVIVLGVLIAHLSGIEWFQNLEMDWGSILATVTVAIPAYVVVCALMTAVGSMSTTNQEGQSLSSIITMLHMIPFYVSLIYLFNPQHPLAVVLSLLPFTALATISMRYIFTIIPAWQVIVCVCFQVLYAVGAIWLASRAFRLGMLRYGQRLNWRKLFYTGQSGRSR